MGYSTDADLYERMDQSLVIQLTDDDNTGSVDQTVLDDKRETCHELVNSYLRGRYPVPMAPAPAILADIEADLLVKKLYQRRPNMDIPEPVQDSYDEAMAQLKDISRGIIELEDVPSQGAESIKTNKTSSDRIFPGSRLDQY